jgi:hypothetical protein
MRRNIKRLCALVAGIGLLLVPVTLSLRNDEPMAQFSPIKQPVEQSDERSSPKIEIYHRIFSPDKFFYNSSDILNIELWELQYKARGYIDFFDTMLNQEFYDTDGVSPPDIAIYRRADNSKIIGIGINLNSPRYHELKEFYKKIISKRPFKEV